MLLPGSIYHKGAEGEKEEETYEFVRGQLSSSTPTQPKKKPNAFHKALGSK